MPVNFQYDKEKNILYCYCKGPATVEEFKSVMTTIISSTEYPPDLNTLWDVKGVDFSTVDKKFEEQLIFAREHFPERGASKIAIIAPDDLRYGMLRMYQALSGGLPQEVQVFRDNADGEKWLLTE